MQRAQVMLGVASACVLLMSACSHAGGSAQPVPDSQQTTSAAQTSESSGGGLPQNGAPAVSDPLATDQIEEEPCQAMSKKQAEGFPGKFTETDIKSGDCVWKYDGEEYPAFGFIGGSIESGNKKGLTKYYGRIDKDVEEVDPTKPLDGYPAVKIDLGLETEGHCLIKVGIRDDRVYDAMVNLEREHPYYDHPCKITRKFAGNVIDNLKQAQ